MQIPERPNDVLLGLTDICTRLRIDLNAFAAREALK